MTETMIFEEIYRDNEGKISDGLQVSGTVGPLFGRHHLLRPDVDRQDRYILERLLRLAQRHGGFTIIDESG